MTERPAAPPGSTAESAKRAPQIGRTAAALPPGEHASGDRRGEGPGREPGGRHDRGRTLRCAVVSGSRLRVRGPDIRRGRASDRTDTQGRDSCAVRNIRRHISGARYYPDSGMENCEFSTPRTPFSQPKPLHNRSSAFARPGSPRLAASEQPARRRADSSRQKRHSANTSGRIFRGGILTRRPTHPDNTHAT